MLYNCLVGGKKKFRSSPLQKPQNLKKRMAYFLILKEMGGGRGGGGRPSPNKILSKLPY